MIALGSSVRRDFCRLYDTAPGRWWLAGWIPGYATGVWAATILSAAACWIGAPAWSLPLGCAMVTGITLIVRRFTGGAQ